jgi:hypothetical protein
MEVSGAAALPYGERLFFDPGAGVDVSGEHTILLPPPSIEPRFLVSLTHSQRKTSSV